MCFSQKKFGIAVFSVFASFTQAPFLTEKAAAQIVEEASLLQSATPWLGVGIEAGKHGVLITQVMPDSPAQQAGLAVGDEIEQVQGEKVASAPALIAAVRRHGVGNTVDVRFLRKGKSHEQKIKLAAKPDDVALLRQRLVDRPAPSRALVHVAGPKLGDLASLKGKTVLLEFWATWCPACRQTQPRLNELQKKHGDSLAVVMVSREDVVTLQDYATKQPPNFTSLRDPTGSLHDEYLVPALPMIVVIDKEGIVREATVGAGSYLESAIELAEKLAAKPAKG